MISRKDNSKYFLYARKSTESEDRQVLSLDSQVEDGYRSANRNHISNIEVIRESRSAKDPGRPLFDEMLDRIKQGEAKGIICWNLNRLSRNPIDAGKIQHMLQQGHIEQIITPSRIYLPGDNVLMMCLEFGMSNQYIRELSDNVKRGLRTKAEQGWKTGLAPIGYLNSKGVKGTNTILKDTERFPLIRKLFDQVLEGISPLQAWKIAVNEWHLSYPNGHGFSRSSFYRMLNNPFYYGWYESPLHSGSWHQGQHEPMITKEEYDRVQVLLGKMGNTRPKDYSFAFTGMIRCGECGASITAEYKKKVQKNGNTHLYTYYHCTKRIKPCTQKSIREEDLNQQVMELLDRIYIPPEFCKWALEQLKLENHKEQAIQEQIDENRENLLKSVTSKLNRLLDMRISDEISEEDYRKKQSELQSEKIRLIEQSKTSVQHITEWMEKAEFVMNFAETAKEKYENGSLETKKAILSLLGSNFLLQDGKLTVEVIKPLLLLQQIEKTARILPERLEPAENIELKSIKGVSYDSSLNLRGWWDSNF